MPGNQLPQGARHDINDVLAGPRQHGACEEHLADILIGFDVLVGRIGFRIHACILNV